MKAIALVTSVVETDSSSQCRQACVVFKGQRASSLTEPGENLRLGRAGDILDCHGLEIDGQSHALAANVVLSNPGDRLGSKYDVWLQRCDASHEARHLRILLDEHLRDVETRAAPLFRPSGNDVAVSDRRRIVVALRRQAARTLSMDKAFCTGCWNSIGKPRRRILGWSTF